MMDFELGLYQVYTNDEFGFFEIKNPVRYLISERDFHCLTCFLQEICNTKKFISTFQLILLLNLSLLNLVRIIVLPHCASTLLPFQIP